MIDNKIPITRNRVFYSDNEFAFENEIVMEYVENDLNQTVIVYEVDRDGMSFNSIYKHVSKENILFKMPKEIPCSYEIEQSQVKSYNTENNGGIYQISGNLKINVLVRVLEKYECDINRGDYIGIVVDTNKTQYFVVTDDGKVNVSNNLVLGAFKSAYRQIIATPCDTEFNG